MLLKKCSRFKRVFLNATKQVIFFARAQKKLLVQHPMIFRAISLMNLNASSTGWPRKWFLIVAKHSTFFFNKQFCKDEDTLRFRGQEIKTIPSVKVIGVTLTNEFS